MSVKNNNSAKSLISRLTRIKQEVEFLSHPEGKASFVQNLDELIGHLSRLREQLATAELDEKLTDVQRPLEQVINFLESAKSNDLLKALLIPAPKPQREPVQIPTNLTNEQIRDLLQKSLSNAELRAIAAQRSIPVGKANNEEIKRNILKNLERQEGYGRLASP